VRYCKAIGRPCLLAVSALKPDSRGFRCRNHVTWNTRPASSSLSSLSSLSTNSPSCPPPPMPSAAPPIRSSNSNTTPPSTTHSSKTASPPPAMPTRAKASARRIPVEDCWTPNSRPFKLAFPCQLTFRNSTRRNNISSQLQQRSRGRRQDRTGRQISTGDCPFPQLLHHLSSSSNSSVHTLQTGREASSPRPPRAPPRIPPLLP